MPGKDDEEEIDPCLRPTEIQLKQLVYRALSVESKAAFVSATPGFHSACDGGLF
jgi:hypothetical protein